MSANKPLNENNFKFITANLSDNIEKKRKKIRNHTKKLRGVYLSSEKGLPQTYKDIIDSQKFIHFAQFSDILTQQGQTASKVTGLKLLDKMTKPTDQAILNLYNEWRAYFMSRREDGRNFVIFDKNDVFVSLRNRRMTHLDLNSEYVKNLQSTRGSIQYFMCEEIILLELKQGFVSQVNTLNITIRNNVAWARTNYFFNYSDDLVVPIKQYDQTAYISLDRIYTNLLNERKSIIIDNGDKLTYAGSTQIEIKRKPEAFSLGNVYYWDVSPSGGGITKLHPSLKLQRINGVQGIPIEYLVIEFKDKEKSPIELFIIKNSATYNRLKELYQFQPM